MRSWVQNRLWRRNRGFLRTLANCIIVLQILFLFSCGDKNAVPEHVTFTEDVAPILNANCNICHRQGGTAHISLMNYTEAKAYVASIAYTVTERLMPPWPADPGYTRFVGERLLSERDKQVLIKWAKQGAPYGPANKMPLPPQYPDGSEIGKPDMRIALTPVLLKAYQKDKFLLVKVPFEFPQDTFVNLIEFMPGNKNVVHHVNGDLVKYKYEKKRDVFYGERVVNMEEDTVHLVQAFEKLGLPNDDGSYPVLQKSVVNYLPGAYGQLYPEGVGGYLLPRKGVFLLNDLHYGFTGKEDVLDTSYINLFFSKAPPKRPMKEFQLGTLGVSPVLPDMQIEPNTEKFVYSEFKVPFDISIFTINPHMHLLGKSFKAYALKPGGDTIRLISIPRWDFGWQYFYTFKKPVKIPVGSIIVAEGVYDNTAKNLNNPFNPPQLITDQRGSMKATDEMFQFIISYLPYQDGDEDIDMEVNRR